jgi:DNA-directed RNA polymerase specialized sigma24 family protein
MSSSGPTVSEWLDNVKEGDGEALRQLWNRYFQRLAQLAGGRVANLATRAVDGEDVAASVFESLWDGAQIGRFDNVQDRHELWWLLVAMTRRKAISHVRKETAAKRGGGEPRVSLSLLPGSSKEFAEVLSREPAPEDVMALDEELSRVLESLRDQKSRRIAVLLLQGHSPDEISRDVGLALATVRRKIRLIRAVWREEFRP